MDHVPLPTRPLIGRLEIPFLCRQSYDGGDLETYPERVGWTVNRWIKPIIFRSAAGLVGTRDIAGFLQTWLFFGLLNNVLDGEVDLDLFKTTSQLGSTFLNTQNLESTVQSWTLKAWEDHWGEDQSALIQWSQKCKSCLREARAVILSLVFALEDEPDDLLSKLCMAIAVLIEYLGHVVNNALESQGLQKLYPGAFNTNRDKLWNPLTTAMRAHGWCPSRLRTLVPDTTETTLLWYYANLKPPAVRDAHVQCTNYECASLQLDTQTYSSAHSIQNCMCSFNGPQPSELLHVVEAGLLPIVIVRTIRGRHVRVHLESRNSDVDFVAISHVWADGNGNPGANTLPSCALQQVQCYVNALRDPQHQADMPFWMDTMCLPVKPQHVRQQAIANMDEAFKHATAVLVLDKYLRTIDSHQISTAEMIARIAASNWTLRMWTFLEGRLAKHIFFQFKDRAIDIHQAMREQLFATVNWQAWSPEQSLAARELDRSLILSYNATRLSYRSKSTDRSDLANIQIALSTRTTSWMSDEPICLGHLFDLNVAKIIQVGDEKMQSFWSLFPHIPSNLVFASDVQKLTRPGFRWAPSSFMLDPKGGFRRAIATPSDDAIISEDGLVTKFPGFRFFASSTGQRGTQKAKFLQRCINGDSSSVSPERLVIQDDLGNWYDCRFEHPWHQETMTLDCDSSPMIILRDANPLAHEAASNQEPISIGLFVTTTDDIHSSSTVHVKAHAQITVRREIDPKRQCLDAIKLCLEDIRNAIAGEPIDFDTSPEIGDAVDPLVPLIKAHQRSQQILHAYKQKPRSNDFEYTDEQLFFLCGLDMVQFLKYGDWYKVEQLPNTFTWCVD